jgi:pyruvate dehydrogenase (quinone)
VVAMEMKVAGMPPFGTDLKNPNFAKMAEVIGIMGIRVENSDDVAESIEKALAHDGPVLIDVLTNPTELAMPPQVNFEETKGFGIYMIKQTLLGDGTEVLDTLKTNFLE